MAQGKARIVLHEVPSTPTYRMQQQAQAAQMAMAQKTFVLDAAEKAARIRKRNADADKSHAQAQSFQFQPQR